MKIKIFIIIIIAEGLICNSCGNRLNGKIEKRSANSVYLVNTSHTKLYRFTLRATKVTDDSLFEYSSQIILLNPGDEKYLGNETGVSDLEYPIVNRITLRVYFENLPSFDEIMKTSKRDPLQILPIVKKQSDTINNRGKIEREYIYNMFYNEDPFIKYGGHEIDKTRLKDTIINNQRAKYEYTLEQIQDSIHAFVRKFKYKYEVKGQIEVKLPNAK